MILADVRGSLMSKEKGSGSLWKASPKLRRFAQQHAESEQAPEQMTEWRANMAVQQAAIKYEMPVALEEAQTEKVIARGAAARARGATQPKARLNVYVQLNRAEYDRLVKQEEQPASHATEDTFQIDLGGNLGDVDVVLNGLVGTASVNEDQLQTLLEHPVVESIDIGEAVRRPLVMQAPQTDGLDSEPQIRQVEYADLHRGGANVLMGIIDVDGFDFSHDEFLDENGKTRFVGIWDQGGSGHRPAPSIRGAASYGSELTRDHLNRAIELSGQHGLAPYHIEPQSSIVSGSHGTHVASIAAGKSGVCPQADIAAVLIDLPEKDLERSRTFSDSTRIADGIAYLLQIQQQNPDRYEAISINISLGTNGHAHDGTSLASRWIDSELGDQGRCICIAAGNAGQDKPETVDDLGFIVGRIHTSGKLDAAGLTRDIHIQVAGFPIEDISENEIEIWYAPQDRINVSVRPPNGGKWSQIVKPGDAMHQEIAHNAAGDELGTAISITSEIYRLENGHNRISVFLTPRGLNSSVEPGVWTIRLHAIEIRDGRYDGWIERDDPIPVHGITPQQLWHYPSFFSGESNVDRTSISTLACTRTAISVANVDDRAEKIAVSSSQGPTRDGQLKPELGAPGTRIVAANGFHPTEQLVAMTGTSMASPYVAGVAALMMAVEPKLTPAQIRGMMVRTARPLPGANYDWRDDAGFGLIDPKRCIEEVRQLQEANRKAEL